jgi:hypothetical protein
MGGGGVKAAMDTKLADGNAATVSTGRAATTVAQQTTSHLMSAELQTKGIEADIPAL